MIPRRLLVALAISAVLCVIPDVASGRTGYYRSNEIGIPFERISKNQVADHRFVLVYLAATETGNKNSEERLLLDSGNLTHRWVKIRDDSGGLLEEADYLNGMLVSERSFDSTGNITVETIYEAGALVSRTTYVYEPLLIRVEATGKDTAVLFRATYQLATTGHLRELIHIAPGEDQSGVRFLFSGGALVEEVITTGKKQLVSRYLAGDRYEVEEWLGDTLQTVRNFERSPGGTLVAEHLTEFLLDRRTTTRFDSEGKLREVLVTERGDQIAMIHHNRDKAGRIVSTWRENFNKFELLEYEYVVSARTVLNRGPDDRLLSLRYEQNGELVYVETYRWTTADEEPPSRKVDYYRDGVPHLRVLFRGDTRTHEQVLRNGQVIRERVFDGS